MANVFVAGSFDDLRSGQIRFLEEASKLGAVHVWLWSDEQVQFAAGRAPKLPATERYYLLASLRYVARVTLVSGRMAAGALPDTGGQRPDVWVADEAGASDGQQAQCAALGVAYRVIRGSELTGFPAETRRAETGPAGRKKVVVTGCFDWFHSGHVRFFEEVSELGDLYVVVGSDENVALLKGAGHPMFPQAERRYVVGAVRFVKQALISSGTGWMDAEPEIAWVKPDFYAVNEDGDKPEKRAFCKEHGLEYVVLKRIPKPGLPRRQSTDLRGF